MLLEGFVAVIALTTIMIVAPGEAKGSPGAVYAAGIGKFLTLLIGKENLIFAITFGAMAFSTFVFDTLDVSTRLGRYILQEFFGSRSFISGVLATAATVGLPAFLLSISREGGWALFWTLFGTSNQLLAALTLLAVTVWLKRTGRRWWFTFLPMLFVIGMTGWSLLRQIGVAVASSGADWLVARANGVAAAALLVLAALVSVEAVRSVTASRPQT
jgi:carbon starvation protein